VNIDSFKNTKKGNAQRSALAVSSHSNCDYGKSYQQRLTVQYHENRATVITDQITIQSEYDGRRPIKSVAGAAETNTGIYHRLLTNNASHYEQQTFYRNSLMNHQLHADLQVTTTYNFSTPVRLDLLEAMLGEIKTEYTSTIIIICLLFENDTVNTSTQQIADNGCIVSIKPIQMAVIVMTCATCTLHILNATLPKKTDNKMLNKPSTF
jgi:hypothetical protein